MWQERKNELTAGIFVALATAALLGVVVWLGAANWFNPAHQWACFYVDEADGGVGLKPGNFITIGDNHIGTVDEIRFDPKTKRCLYVAQINSRDAEIHADGAAVVSSGLVGEARLVVTNRGSSAAPLADESHPVHVVGGLDAGITDLSLAARETRNILTSIRNQLEQPYTAGALLSLQRTVANIEKASATAVGVAANLQRETDPASAGSFVAKANKVADDAGGLIADARPEVKRILTAAASTAEQLDEYSKKDLSQLFASFRAANTKVLEITNSLSNATSTAEKLIVLNRDNVDRMIGNMTIVSETLRATASEIERNPWRLIYKPDKSQMHSYNIMTATADFSRGAASLDMAIDKLKNLDPNAYPAAEPELKEVREHLSDTFTRFKRIEDALWKELAGPEK